MTIELPPYLLGAMAVLKHSNRPDPGPDDSRQQRYGFVGERAAREYLERQGMKFLAANLRSTRGEIDLLFKITDPAVLPKTLASRFAPFLKAAPSESDCLVFVEVKTRAANSWTRPARAVDAEKRRALSRCALDYVRMLKNPYVKIRIDVVEVLMEGGAVSEVRHLPNAFNLSRPYRYG